MKDVLSKLFSFLKYILLIISFGLVLFCIMTTYVRLEKPLTEAVGVFVPFVFVLVIYLINIVIRSKAVGNNLLFNFVSCMIFIVTIVICLRSMFDKNMLLYYKYELNFNPAFFADNLSAIEFMLYMIGITNVMLLIVGFLSKKTNDSIGNSKKEKYNFSEEQKTIGDAVLESKKRIRQSE